MRVVVQGFKGGQQRSSQARGDLTGRRRENAGGNGDYEVRKLASDVELHVSGQVGREICRGSWKRLKKALRILKWSGESDEGDVGLETRRDDHGCAPGFARKEVDDLGHDEGQRHRGAILVEHGAFTCAEHGGNRILRGRHGSG